MNNKLKDLVQCGDAGGLEMSLRVLCSEFGSVSHLDILTMNNAGKRRAVCLLRLESMAQEQKLMSKLGAVRFGADLCVVVDMRTPAEAQA